MDIGKAILIGVGAILALNIVTAGKAGEAATGAVTDALASVPYNAGTSLADYVLIKPYEWSQEQEYIPIIDELAQGAVWFKNLGSDDRWFW
jgi:hypothetical protein